jgi:quercetin dioxygenase-like cupin family protein
MKLSPKSFRKAEPHQKGTIEHIFVIRGSVLAGEITNPKLIKAGESLEFRGDMPHLYMNIDEEEAIAYVVIIFKGR